MDGKRTKPSCEGCCAWPMREGSGRRIASLSLSPLSNGVFFFARQAKRWPQAWLLAQAALGYFAGTSLEKLGASSCDGASREARRAGSATLKPRFPPMERVLDQAWWRSVTRQNSMPRLDSRCASVDAVPKMRRKTTREQGLLMM